jgi:AIPR protein
MSIIQVNHIQSNCRARFSSLIDMSDITTKDPEEKDAHFLSRALAALSVAALAKTDDLSAAQSVVDEFSDDGIDAFFFDRNEHIAYLVQSKWVRNGTSSVDVGSILKFLQGVNHLLENKMSLLGPKMQAKSQDIQDTLADSQATFVMAIAYTGKPPLSNEALEPINQLLSELNDDGDMVSLQVLRQKELHEIVETGAMGSSIDLTIMLHEYGMVREPYKAYYGQVDVSDVTSWGKFGDRLYHKNIRSFKGSTEVNDAIVATVKSNPDNFLYFNNGITLLCTSLEKQPLGGKSKSSGVFECKGSSVINGAQTVGSIISALSSPDSGVSNARVMVRLISLEGCPPDFAFDVTRATNTQNKIEKRDFAALDKEQSRLRSDLLLSLGKEYVFRTGDQAPAPDKGCTLDEATVALACANPDITYCVDAKRAISRLYEDIEKPPYTVLFNSSLSATKLWRAVEVLRKVDEFLKNEQRKRDGKERLIAIHGNRVLLYLVFRALGPGIFDGEKAEADIGRVPRLAAESLARLTNEVLTNHSSSYPGNIFKNTTKCKAIVSAIA